MIKFLGLGSVHVQLLMCNACYSLPPISVAPLEGSAKCHRTSGPTLALITREEKNSS